MNNVRTMTQFADRLSLVLGGAAALFFIIPASLKAAPFSCGADVSWLPQMEAAGTRFYDDAGVQKDCLQILKEHGINSIRLRVWVNPSADRCTGHCSRDETVAMARRAADSGFRVMIDFHYSDSWADPGKQNKPAAWSSHTTAQLVTDVYNHTTDVLNAVIAAGVRPEWVQVGNETNDGMLWENGRASANGGFASFTSLVNSGYNAVKAVDSTIKVIIHISNGYDNALFRWMFDGLTANNARYDMIGMSSYPSASNWTTRNSQILTNMNDMVARYGKDVMIAEVGMDASATTRQMLTDLIGKVESVTNGRGRGVFIWEPQCYNWCSYSLGAWNTNGRPGVAMDAFLTATGVTGRRGNTAPTGLIKTIFNPASSKALLCFRVSEDGFVALSVFDVMGKKVAAIVDQSMRSGTWTATWNTEGLSAGTYFCRVRYNDRAGETARFLLVK